MSLNRGLFRFYVLLFVLCGFSLPVVSAPTNQASIFQSKGKPVRMEWFEPVGPGPHPIVILLHGQGGINTDSDDNFFRSSAARFCEAGFNAGVLHYFDREGIKSASSAQMGRHFSDWLGTIGDAITYAKKETGESKVALFGHSLGAQLALIQASRDKRASCVVELSGSLVFPLRKGDKLPPVLILHGDGTALFQFKKNGI